MPTYEYKCANCGKFEVFQRITEDPLANCPTCGGPVQRLISGSVNLIFKGSGFHITDYRSKEYKDRSKAESSSKTESTVGSDS